MTHPDDPVDPMKFFLEQEALAADEDDNTPLRQFLRRVDVDFATMRNYRAYRPVNQPRLGEDHGTT